jgi:hypothetical protein
LDATGEAHVWFEWLKFVLRGVATPEEIGSKRPSIIPVNEEIDITDVVRLEYNQKRGWICV